MAATTYGKISEMIRTDYYKKYPSENANYTLRHIAEHVAQELAYQAVANAYEQDKVAEAVFSNDQFIVTYNGLELLTDTNGTKYIPFPNPPAGLPQGREIAYVGITGNKKTQIFPQRSKDRFMQQFTHTPKWMILCYVENGNILFDNMASNITGPIDLKLVGAVPIGDNLLDLPLNMPKSLETIVMDRIMSKLISQRQVLPDNVNDNVSR